MSKEEKTNSQSSKGIFLVENRKDPRLSVKLPFDYSLVDGKEVHKGVVADASEGGLLIYLSEKIDVGTFLRIEILLGKPVELITIKAIGRVVWADLAVKESWAEYCYGVQFLSFFEGDLQKLKTFLKGVGQILSQVFNISIQEGLKQSIALKEDTVKISLYDVLVVDDEKGLRNRVMTFLSKRGHQCLPAINGIDALNITTREKFDAVITDLYLPKMDGITLTKKLLKLTPNLPIMVMTASDNELSPVAAIAAGAQEFIKKPFSLTELSTRFDKMMSAHEISSNVD